MGSVNVLEEAQKIIYGDREHTYGKPSKNLDCNLGGVATTEKTTK